MHGTLKWLRPAKGYGYIAPADGGEDVFVRLDAGAAFAVGDALTFRVVEGSSGPEARHVVRGHVPDDDMG
jgi:CspA family cold shock protein